MRKKLEQKTGNDLMKLPTFLVKFCYNRAVVSMQVYPNSPKNHIDVGFGPLFFLRVAFALWKNWMKY